MEIINHEYYVSLEVAKLLKEAGFDWKCRGIYVLDSENDPEYVFSTANFTNTLKEIEGYIRLSAPTLDVAQRWLREVKDIDVYIFPTTNNKRRCVYEWGIKTFGRTLWDEGQPDTTQYDTYEETQEVGIMKALEIILEL